MNTIKRNPYIGAQPFQESDRESFFGREQEANELLALALSEQEIVFYAQSGAGKSSLVNTCLIPDLKKKGFEVLLGRVGGDAPSGLEADNIFVFNLLRSLSTREVDINSLTSQMLTSFLVPAAADESASAGRTSTRRALIIDQFEEIFSRHHEAWEKRKDFFEQLAQVLEDDPRLRVILVMREDFIAALDPYANLLPSRLRMRYFMQRLEFPAALKAVTEPVKRKEFSRPYDSGAAEKLVDDLRTIKVIKPDGTSDVGVGQFVEPLYLQVICYELWNKLPEGGATITKQNVLDVGDVGTALMNLYATSVKRVADAENVSEAKIRKWFTDKLISPAGIRNMVLQEAGETSANLENKVIRALSDLVRAEQRGGAIFYELTHDRLAQPIITSNRIWFEEHLSALQKQAALWNAQGKTDSWLLTDQALVEVEEWAKAHSAELTETEKEFLETCQKKQKEQELEAKRKSEEQEREVQHQKYEAAQKELELAQRLADVQARAARRARRFSVISGVLVVIAIIATFSANTAARDAANAAANALESEQNALAQSNIAQEQFNIARSSELSTIALGISDSELDLALLLGVQADSFDSNFQTQKTLAALLQKSGRYRGSITAEEDILEIQYTPDGKTFASRDKKGITLWDAETRQPLNDSPLNGHFYGVTALAISKDGNLMASGATDGTIVIWDAVKRQAVSEPFKAHNTGVGSLAFSMDGKTLASASGNENAIMLWDITDPADPQPIGEPLLKHTSGILSIAFSPDGKTLASGSYDTDIVLWDLTTREPIGEPIDEHQDWVNKLAYIDDGNILASASDDSRVILWDVKDPADPQKISELRNEIYTYIRGLAISPDEKTLAFGNVDGSIILWDISDPQSPEKIGEVSNPDYGGYYINLAFSADNKILASSTYNGTIILWDAANYQKISESAKGGSSAISVIVIAPDKKTLISASSDSTISFWDISNRKKPGKTGEPLQEGHPGQPYGMQFSSDGSLLESYGDDGTVLLDVKTRKPIGTGNFYSSPDGNILTYQTLDKATNQTTIYLRDTETGETIGAPISGQNSAFSPDSKKLVFHTSDKDGLPQLHLWDITAKKEMAFPKSSNYSAFSKNGRILVYQTTSEDGSQSILNLWDITAGESLGENIEGSYLVISPDNKTLAYQTSNSDSGEALINLWDIANAVEIRKVPGSYLSLSQDNKVLAFAVSDLATGISSINLLDTTTGASLIEPVKNGNFPTLSADGKILLYQTPDGLITVLDTKTGATIGDPVPGNINRSETAGQIFVCEIYNYNSATEKNDFSIILINTSTATQIGNSINGSYVNLVQDGKILIYQASDGKLNFLNTNGNWLGALEGTLANSYITTDAGGEILVYRKFENNTNNIKLWDITASKDIGEPFNENYGTYFSISPDSKTLVTRSENNAIIFWDVTRTWPLGDPITEKTDTVSSATLNPDGKTLAIADASGITLQDTASGKINNILSTEHAGRVNSVTLSPDKNTLLSVGEDGKTIIWDLKTSQRLSDPIAGYAFFSPNGGFVAIVDGIENTATLWNLANQQIIGEPFSGQNVVFSPGEKFVAIGDEIKNTITLWDLTTEQVKVIGEPFTGQSATFSPDGDTLILFNGNTAILWDLTTQQAIGEPLAGQSVFFSPDSKTLAVSLYEYDGNNNIYTTTLFDLTARAIVGKPINGYLYTTPDIQDAFVIVDTIKNTTTFWEWETKKPVAVPISGSDINFSGTKINILVVRDYVNNKTTLWNPVMRIQIGKSLAGIYYPSFSPDATLISMADLNNNTTIILDLITQKQVGTAIKGYYNPTICTDNKTVAWFDTSNTTAAIWDLEQDQSLGKLELVAESANNGVAITFNPGCDVVALGDYSQNKTTLWDLTKKSPIGEKLDGSYATFSSDGSVVAIVDNKEIVTTFWRVADGVKVGKNVQGSEISINPENNNIIVVNNYNSNAGSYAHTIWDMNNITQIDDEQSGYYYPMFKSDDVLIIYGKNGVTFWDVDNNKMIGQPLRGHSSPVTNMLFSPDGNILASLATDGIVLTDLDKGSSAYLGTGDYSGQLTEKMAFSPDSKRLTAFGSDGTILVWDVASNVPALKDVLDAPYKDFVTNVNRLAVSPDGKYLIYETNKKLNIWDIENEKPVGEQTEIKNLPGGVIAFSSDGKSMFFNDGGTIFRWDEWNSPDKGSVPVEILSSGQNNIGSLSLVMGTEGSGYLIATSTDDYNNFITQIWDLTRYSKVGDPISGYLQVYGSNPQAQVLIYKNKDGQLIKWDLNPATWKKYLCEKAGRNFTREEWDLYIGDALEYQTVCP